MIQNKKQLLGLVLVVVTILVVVSSPFQQFASLPDEIRIFEGHTSELQLTLPASGSVSSENGQILGVDGQYTAAGHAIQAIEEGITSLTVKWRNFPLKTVKVNVLPDVEVYPGGQSIGVKLNAEGPLVVGHHFIEQDDQKISPAEQADIQIGDMISKINNKRISKMEQIGELVEQYGAKDQPLRLELIRNEEKVSTEVHPVYDQKQGKYRLGLYIRHSAAGVGTLTFVHPKTQAYGALGHVISDVDTHKPVVIGDGEIVESEVRSIEKGTRGVPGEKFSQLNEKNILGSVRRNTAFGIFGVMDKKMKNAMADKPVQVGLREEVEKGPAHILTVVEGDEVQKYEIEVVDIVEQKFPATKGLVIKVTDEKLLKKTGGIVQGMSGSPILQNGKLIGAVTHVLVNDPTSGYGCFIEWMLSDAGISLESQPQTETEPETETENTEPKAS